MGDVLRTTPILTKLKNNHVSWMTKKESKPLLENNPYLKNIYTSVKEIENKNFDLILSLDDEKEGCEIINHINYKSLIGFYLEDEKIKCTPSAKEWYAMGLNGGPDRDELKKANTKTHQQLMFQMLGHKFKGEEYILNHPRKKVKENIIGLETKAGERWLMKKWPKYKKLGKLLKKNGYKIKYFKHRLRLKNFIEDVNNCKLIVTGDTLTMHVGLALRKKVIALFGPTSPVEIHEYGRLTKIVPKMDCICCYKKDKCKKKPTCMEAITIQQVYDQIKKNMI